MKNYIVTSVEEGKLIGGNKAKKDVRFFLTNNSDFQPINIIEKKGKLKKLIYSQTILKKIVKESKADNFILQYPVASEFLENSFIRLVRKYTNANFFILVHDISSLQYPDIVGKGFQERELNLFRKADGLIIHNKEMKKWLLNHNVNVPMVELGVFDYQTDDPMQKNIPFSGSIDFAGGLGRAGFLQKLKIKHSIHIMGPNRMEYYPECVKYDGQFTPDKLAKHLLQNFGLVWSGDSIETCTGSLGQYLKYNDPHKVSLYLSNGMPIIIWREAALAGLIRDKKLGIVVDDLNNLDETLDAISNDEYVEMKNNARRFGEMIRKGSFITHAANLIISNVNQGSER